MQIHTARLLLRELALSDAEAANLYERDPEVVRYQSHDVRTLEESRDYIRRSVASVLEVPRRTFDFAAVLRDEQRVVGRVGLHVTSVEAREGKLWYVLHPALWGRGLVPEACRALLELGFGELGLHRLFVDCDPANLASARVAEKLGMRREAHFVENAWIKGAWSDSVIYALLDREWRASR